MKAVFTVTIQREKRHISRANMHLNSSQQLGPNLFADHYAKSVRMSTYLVAISVFDFANISKITTNTVKPIHVSGMEH